MKLRTFTVGGIGLSLVVSLLTFGACGGDNSAVNATGGSANAGGAGNNGGSGNGTGGTVTAGGSNGTGGTTSAANPNTWGFYQDTEGWQTGTVAGTATATAASPNATGKTYCNGSCADIVLVFAGEATQTVNFMKYWGPPPTYPYQDFTGKTLVANIKIDDQNGVISDIEFHPQSGGSYVWGQAATVNNGTPPTNPTLASIIASTTAVQLTIPVAGTGTFDATQIQGIGFNINGGAGKSGTAHLYVDSVTVQ